VQDRADKQLKIDARRIFYAALQAVDPAEAVSSAMQIGDSHIEVQGHWFELTPGGRILVVGAGKGSALMADALEVLLGERIAGGVVTVKDRHALPLRTILVGEAGHPTPDRRGQAQAEQVLRMLAGTTTEDLVLCVISGGGSALWPLPAPGLTLADKMQTTSALLACSAPISDINCVRKHISRIKGGQLARSAAPATVISLILSDVIGDPFDAIASGPTAPDPTTYAEALRIAQSCAGSVRPAQSVIEHLERGTRGEYPETPSVDDPCFATVHNFIVGNNELALQAAARAAKRAGYQPVVEDKPVDCQAHEAVPMLLAKAKAIQEDNDPVSPPACIIAGGETTVALGDSTGKGGRNQEMALAAAIDLKGQDGIAFLAGGTDGTDGPTDAAGAVVDGETVGRGQKLGRDAREYLANHDSYSYFSKMEEHIITGPTLTNVMDVNLVLVK